MQQPQQASPLSSVLAILVTGQNRHLNGMKECGLYLVGASPFAWVTTLVVLITLVAQRAF